MGDWYELKVLGDVFYIEYSNEQTKWQSTVRELTEKEIAELDIFEGKQSEERRNFMKSLLLNKS